MKLKEILQNAQRHAIEDALIEILLEVHGARTVKECQHIIKAKILSLK